MRAEDKFKLFKDKNYIKLWIAQIVSILGDWTYFVAISAMFYNFTQSSEGIVKFKSVQTLALLLSAPFIGVMVDRINRKYLMIASELINIVVLVVLLIFPNHLIFYIVGISISIVNSLFGTAKTSFLPDVIDEEQLVTANSVSSTTSNLMLIFGGALGGIIVATGGYRLAFMINIISCIISSTLLCFVKYKDIRKPTKETKEKTSYLGGFKSSFSGMYKDIEYCVKYLQDQKAIMAIIWMFVLLSFGAGAINVLSIVFANQVLLVGSKGYGFLLTAQGIGSLVAGSCLVFLNRLFNPFKLFSIGFLMMGLSMTLLGFTSTFLIAAILYFTSGFGNVIFLVTSTSVMQKTILSDFRGKVFSFQYITAQSALLLGMVFTGVVERYLNIRTIISIGGGFELAGAIFSIIFFARMKFEMEDSPKFISVE